MYHRMIFAAILGVLFVFSAGCVAPSQKLLHEESNTLLALETPGSEMPLAGEAVGYCGNGARDWPVEPGFARAAVGESEPLRMQTNNLDQVRKARTKSESARHAAGDPFLAILVLGLIIIVIEGAQR